MDEKPNTPDQEPPPAGQTPPASASAGGTGGGQTSGAPRPAEGPARPQPRPPRPAPGGSAAPRHGEAHGAKAPEPRLNPQGEATASLLRQALTALAPEIGGRDDEPVATVPAGVIQRACQICKDDVRLDFKYLRCLSVVDYNDHFEVVYHLYSLDKRHKAVLKANVPAENPRLPTVVPVWRGADWYEREGHDLFGVVFEGHPNLVPLLLYEGFEGFPGRKSFPFHDYQEW